MATRATVKSVRRQPQQRRAIETMNAVLDAVVRILKREGSAAVTTNHVAEVAGISIGSLYQYFPDKHAIFAALHKRHIDEVDRLVGKSLVEHAGSSLDTLMRALIEAMIDAHTRDPELYELLATEVPHRADGTRDFAVRLHGAFLLAIASRARGTMKRRDLDKAAFIVAHMVESLSHGAVLRRPPRLSLEEARDEAVRAVLAYLRDDRGA
jgi:AcrR family transcriptional regulator